MQFSCRPDIGDAHLTGRAVATALESCELCCSRWSRDVDTVEARWSVTTVQSPQLERFDFESCSGELSQAIACEIDLRNERGESLSSGLGEAGIWELVHIVQAPSRPTQELRCRRQSSSELSFHAELVKIARVELVTVILARRVLPGWHKLARIVLKIWTGCTDSGCLGKSELSE